MKILKRILAYLALAIILLLTAGFFFVQHLKPDYDGTLYLQGLQDSVTVHYDTYGIPHIYADREIDAFRALGYVHAQDRLWQMELLRRVAPGRLSEVFGVQALPADKLFLTLGIAESSRKTLADQDLSAPALLLAQSYVDGLNQFIEEGPTPLEFYLTGLEKQPFTLEDIYNSIGYMAFSFAMAHKTDPFLMEVKERLGMDYVSELLLASPASGTSMNSYDSRVFSDSMHIVSSRIGHILDKTPLPALEGSNSWVIGPEKTKSGKVILANDPHIGFAQPSVWYEAHIITPEYEKYGYHLAGIPFPMLGHNRNHAYGVTMFENDDIDFYSETLHSDDSTKYNRNGEWKTFEVLEKTISVKDEPPVTFNIYKTDKGPVMNGVIEPLQGVSPISMSWVYTQGENQLINALYSMTHASDLASFEEAVSDIHAPGLNIMYGDAEGNVAWWAAARLYKVPDSLSTKLFLDGANGPEVVELPFGQNPRALNPPWGYVYSANNQADSTISGEIPGYYLPENRARRIVNLLEAKNNWDREGVMEMINDVTSPVNPEIISNLAADLEGKNLSEAEQNSLEILEKWSGDYPLDSKAAVLFHRWVYYFLVHTFRDELGTDGFKSLLNTHLLKRLIAPISTRNAFIWWDDVTTDDRVEGKADIALSSFKAGVASVISDFGNLTGDWGWEDVHSVEYQHPIGRVAALRSFFNVGPYPVNGSREVINNLMFPYDSTGYYKVSAGPSTRRVIDFSDLNESRSILPTGQSGNPFSPHYEDQAEMYIRGEFRKMLINSEEIRINSQSTLIFIGKDF